MNKIDVEQLADYLITTGVVSMDKEDELIELLMDWFEL